MAAEAAPPERIAVDSDLLLRREAVNDGEAVAAAVGVNLSHLSPWMPWATPDAARAENQRERLMLAAEAWDRGTEFTYLLMPGNESAVLGGFGLHRRIGPGGIEIGYWLDRDHTGRGRATAAVRALIDAALSLPGVDRLEIHCDQGNRPSQAIPRRLGFRLDRVEARDIRAPAETGNDMIWVLEKPEEP